MEHLNLICENMYSYSTYCMGRNISDSELHVCSTNVFLSVYTVFNLCSLYCLQDEPFEVYVYLFSTGSVSLHFTTYWVVHTKKR